MCHGQDLECIQHILGWSEKSKSLRFRVAIKGNPHKTLAGDQVQTGPGSLRVEWLRGGENHGIRISEAETEADPGTKLFVDRNDE